MKTRGLFLLSILGLLFMAKSFAASPASPALPDSHRFYLAAEAGAGWVNLRNVTYVFPNGAANEFVIIRKAVWTARGAVGFTLTDRWGLEASYAWFDQTDGWAFGRQNSATPNFPYENEYYKISVIDLLAKYIMPIAHGRASVFAGIGPAYVRMSHQFQSRLVFDTVSDRTLRYWKLLAEYALGIQYKFNRHIMMQVTYSYVLGTTQYSGLQDVGMVNKHFIPSLYAVRAGITWIY